MKVLLIAGLVLLSGAVQASAQTAKPAAKPAAASAGDRLPKEMLGAWSTNLEACGETASEAKMTVEPKIILYYEVSQSVRKVTKLKDGWLRVSGKSADLDGEGPSTVEIKLDGDKLTIGKDGQTYHRCPKGSPQ